MKYTSLNTTVIRHLFNRHAPQLTSVTPLIHEIAARVSSRLDYIKLNPQRILDCGSGLAIDCALLQQRYPAAEIVQLDLAVAMLRQANPAPNLFKRLLAKARRPSLICADACALPLATASIDFCYANLLLPYLRDVVGFIHEMRRVLSLGGSFCISGLGVDSLQEVRKLGLTTYGFPDMHDIGDLLLNAGFTNPVVDTEYLTLEYEDLAQMLTDLRLLGCGGALGAGASLGKARYQQLQTQLKLPQKLTLELFVAHGWKDKTVIDLPPGHAPVNFQKGS